MHCAACSDTAQKALLSVSDVLSASVDAVSGRAHLQVADKHINHADLDTALRRCGFTLKTEVQSGVRDDTGVRAAKAAQRAMLWRWLIAGLCMMQVMMYTTPHYFSGAELSDAEMQMLNWAAWALTLILVLFACGPYFQGAWRGLRTGSISMDLPVALSVIIVFVFGTVVTFSPQTGWGRDTYLDSLSMFMFFLLSGRWIEANLRLKTVSSLSAVIDRLPQTAQRKEENTDEFVTCRRDEIAPGDIVRVRAGEIIPADGMVHSKGAWIDEALLTGEFQAVFRAQGDTVIAGSQNQTQSVDIKVTRIGRDTRYAQMAEMVQSAALQKPAVVLLADRIAKPFILAVLLIALAVFFYHWNESPARAILNAATVLIVTCPCALALGTPTALLASAGALARHGVLVRNFDALEAISKIDHVMFDKTGTLTLGAVQLAEVSNAPGFENWNKEWSATIQALAKSSIHPISKALEAALRVANPAPANQQPRLENIQEIPGEGVLAKVSFASGHQYEVRLGSSKFVGLAQVRDEAKPSAHFAVDGTVAVTFGFNESIRDGAAAVVDRLNALDIKTSIVSGDSFGAVNHVAAQLGIIEAQGRCFPEDKLRYVSERQANREHVAMVGDGLNDGPALSKANVSIAMGESVPIAQTNADIVVVRNDLNVLTRLVVHARKTQHIIAQNLVWAAAYNLACVPMAMLGLLPPWLAGLGMVGSSLLVTLNALRLNTFSSENDNPWKSSPSSSPSQLPSCC
jgi:P-type Cu2+ transporter